MIQLVSILACYLRPASSFQVRQDRHVPPHALRQCDAPNHPSSALLRLHMTADLSEGFEPSPTSTAVDRKTRDPPMPLSSAPVPKSTASTPTTTRNVLVLICPAQFCVPDDYQDLVQHLSQWQYQHPPSESSTSVVNNNAVKVRGAVVAPLPRTEWVRVAQQVPTSNFWTANLSVYETLSWYFDAIDRGIAELLTLKAASGSDDKSSWSLCIVGHSIGGWVARAYLGSMSRSSTAAYQWAQSHCTSLITLGTPHVVPTNQLQWLDQTRGLLREIDMTPSCRASSLLERGIDITCVCSNAISAKLSSNVEEMVALASYLPLLGPNFNMNTQGDGIVPLDLAFLEEPARKLIINSCPQTKASVRHAHVVPTPWNLWDGSAPSIALPNDDFASYVSPGVASQWAPYIQ